MTQHIVYNFDSTDSNWETVIEQSFSLVWDFCRELHNPSGRSNDRTPERVAYNRVLNGQFEAADVAALSAYAKTVAERARRHYAAGSIFSAAEWREAVLQNADRLEQTATDFTLWFQHANQPESAPVC